MEQSFTPRRTSDDCERGEKKLSNHYSRRYSAPGRVGVNRVLGRRDSALGTVFIIRLRTRSSSSRIRAGRGCLRVWGKTFPFTVDDEDNEEDATFSLEDLGQLVVVRAPRRWRRGGKLV